jgi:phosphohistidine phosphatase
LNNYLMAEQLMKKHEKPDIIYCSPAIRALHTAIIVARVFNVNFTAVVICNSILNSGPSGIIELIEETDSKVKNLMVIGHNPTFTSLSNLYLPESIENLPTSGVVTLKFDSKNWNIIDKTPVFSEIDYPQKRLNL